ncbi:uncharacterized protein TNCV_2421571 [Trichonephila clavipes]|nr:uncharacterized protein TNCV_2421571 [Trichonephila clavipes]
MLRSLISHHIWHSRERLRDSGQTIGRLRKTCANAVPRTIPISLGPFDASIATKSIFESEVDDEFSELKTKAFRILLPFSTPYLCEAGFSAVAALKTEYRSQLNIEKELRVSISNIKPSFENLCSARQAHGSH